MMTLSEMRSVLAQRGIRLTKSLGQTFMFDGNQLRRIVATAQLRNTDRCIEIGPGLGPLTELLLERASHVLAIEKDARLVSYLRERFSNKSNLVLIEGDAMEYLRNSNADWRKWKVVSNLPYSVASPILVELAQHPNAPETIVVTVQLEVAHRLIAQPGSKNYGVLTLLVQARYEPHQWFRISASCFYPEPKVDSACIRLDRRKPELLPCDAAKCFTYVVKTAFAQRRKMMMKVLRNDFDPAKLEMAFKTVGLDYKVRPENVSVDQFARLAQILH